MPLDPLLPLPTLPAAPNSITRPATFVADSDATFGVLPSLVDAFNTNVPVFNAAVDQAATSASSAATQVTLSTTQASASATSAAASASSASTATTQKGLAETAASTATTQAGIATAAAASVTTAANTANAKAAEATAAAATAVAVTLGVSTGHPVVRPTLNLDFANSQTVDPRITFTRASTATRTNAKGLIESVAPGVPRIDYDPITLACKGLLIEESRTNLFTYSQDFDNSAWGKYAPLTVGFANSVVAPNGSLSADVLSTTNSGSVYQEATASGTGTYTASIYAHTSSTCANANITCFFLSNTAEAFSLRFNPSTGAFISVDAGVAYSITNCGGGWFRYAITFTGTNASNTFVRFQIYDNTTTANTLVLWGAQLEAGAFPTTYIPSSVTHTGRSSTATFIGSNGLIQTAASGVARYSYNPLNLSVSPSLLLEAASTNLLTYSEQFDNAAWLKGTVSISANAQTAPDGTTTADTVTDSTGSQFLTVSLSMTAGDTTARTLSLYLKPGTAVSTSLSLNYFVGGTTNSVQALVTWSTRSASMAQGTATGSSVSLVDVGNGWYRLSATGANSGGANSSIQVVLYPAHVGTGTVHIWGAQLEAGSYPTSYIPTTTAAVTRAVDTSTSAATTRAADVATMTGVNLSSWWNPSEGAFVVEAQQPTAANYSGTYRHVLHATAAATGATAIGVLVNYAGQISGAVNVGGSATNLIGPSNTGAVFKSALAYKPSDQAFSANGQSPATGSSGMSLPESIVQMSVGTTYGSAAAGFLDGHIRSIRYYPARLTNAQLQAISA